MQVRSPRSQSCELCIHIGSLDPHILCRARALLEPECWDLKAGTCKLMHTHDSGYVDPSLGLNSGIGELAYQDSAKS